MTALLKQMQCDISFYSISIYFNQLSLQSEGPTGILNYTNRRYSLHIREGWKQKLWRQEQAMEKELLKTVQYKM